MAKIDDVFTTENLLKCRKILGEAPQTPPSMLLDHIPPIPGLLIVPSEFLTEQAMETVVRSFWERWFTLPWKPMKKFKTVQSAVPAKVFLLRGNVLVGHPDTIKRFIGNPAKGQE